MEDQAKLQGAIREMEERAEAQRAELLWGAVCVPAEPVARSVSICMGRVEDALSAFYVKKIFLL